MFDKENLLKEVEFKAVLSGGPGGQHANKTSTKVELYWKVEQTTEFTHTEIHRILKNLKPRLTKEHVLLLSSNETRSQFQNKTRVTDKFFEIVESALKVPKKRKKTKPSKVSKLKRLHEKRLQTEKKERRKNPNF